MPRRFTPPTAGRGTQQWWRNVGFAEGGARGGRKNRTTEQIIEPDEKIVLFASFKRDGQRSHADGLCEIQEVCVISNDPTGSAANSLIHWAKEGLLKAHPYAIARFFFAQDVPIDQSPQGSSHR